MRWIFEDMAQSGVKGHIAYIGQLEDDIEDFVHAAKLAQPFKWIIDTGHRRWLAWSAQGDRESKSRNKQCNNNKAW